MRYAGKLFTSIINNLFNCDAGYRGEVLCTSRKQDIQDEETHLEDSEISKSQIKRELKALQALGEKIVNLSETQRKKIPMDDVVDEAISLAARLQGKTHCVSPSNSIYRGFPCP